ncbi:DNA adenine methylase, partial [Rhodovulum sulfidophilum]|nr:DNA adenine methylase [Rhodovulum sulfidophilum]
YRAYVEPFVGMGGIFLRRRFRPRLEVMNDRNGEIINLFRILQRHYPQLLEIMRFQICSRREFDRLRLTDPATLTDLERAARFLYLQRLSFGGKLDGVFGVSAGHGPRFSLARLEPVLDAAHERLDGVVFESLDWADLIPRYDTAETLFYLDPPYFGGENDYGKAPIRGRSRSRPSMASPEAPTARPGSSSCRFRSGSPGISTRASRASAATSS